MTPTLKSFTQTSNKPYDRHYYTVNRPYYEPLTFGDYESMRSWWFQQSITEGFTVNVMDYTTQKRISGGQGF